jgi:hypothetical protein
LLRRFRGAKTSAEHLKTAAAREAALKAERDAAERKAAEAALSAALAEERACRRVADAALRVAEAEAKTMAAVKAAEEDARRRVADAEAATKAAEAKAAAAADAAGEVALQRARAEGAESARECSICLSAPSNGRGACICPHSFIICTDCIAKNGGWEADRAAVCQTCRSSQQPAARG